MRDGSAGLTTRRLIGCSADRTLIAVATEGQARLVKIFESGSMAEAEREQHAADIARGPGVVPCIGRGTDELTGRPMLEFPLLDGIDAGRRIDEQGPLSSTVAAKIALELASTLERIARIETPEAPDGLVHGDVKPANVFLTGEPESPLPYLLDFEHAVPAEPGTDSAAESFTGGTHGYAPPEAYAGARPTTAFDVFGFGRSLETMVLGMAPHRATQNLEVLPSKLRSLCEDCTRDEPSERPDWPAIRTRLEAIVADADSDYVAESARIAIAAADFDSATRSLAELDFADERKEPLEALLSRRRRVWKRVEAEAGPPTSNAAGSLAEMARHCRALATIRRRFPKHSEALFHRNKLLADLGSALIEVPAKLKQLIRDGEFDRGCSIISDCGAALEASAPLGRLPVEVYEPDSIPGIVRTPHRVLELAAQDLQIARERHSAFHAQLDAAEAELNLTRARSVVEDVAELHGGASRVSATFKDRLHTFEFTLSRIAGGAHSIDECKRLLTLDGVNISLEPARKIVELAAAQTSHSRQTHCRSLLRSLEELASERPHLADPTQDARGALRSALETLTQSAWEALARAERSLLSTPIPIRPLQADVNRIDQLDLAGALIDQVEGSRTDLLDALETVRVRVERARATRDRIARGVEESLDQGHLTTALYDMERVANQFDDETSQAAQPLLRDRYEAAKQLKNEVQTALQANNELASRYHSAREDSSASPEMRIELLRDRERMLEFLCRHVGEHRRALYEGDLSTVRFLRFEETAAAGTKRYESSASHTTRSDIAEQVARELSLLVPIEGWSEEQLTQVRLEIATWRARGQAAAPPTAKPSRSDRGRLTRLGILLVGLLVAAGLFWTISSLTSSRGTADLDSLANQLDPALTWRASPHDISDSLIRLRNFAAAMPKSDTRTRAARSLLDIVESSPSTPGWIDQLGEAVRDLESTLQRDSFTTVHKFGRAAHSTACVRALVAGLDIRAHVKATQDSPIAPPEDIVARTRDE